MVSADPKRIEVGNSENDGMHGIEPICEEKRVNGYQPDQDDGTKIT
jgi:hypothetical protein